MDVERRVKVLEDEIKILKNQIQNTLLDIQEEIVGSAGVDKRATRTNAQQASTPMEAAEQLAPAVAASLPAAAYAVKQVSARDSEPVAVAPRTVSAAGDTRPAPDMDLAMFARLVAWAKNGASRAGSAATRQALEVAVSNGQLPQVMRANLEALLPKEDGQPAADIGEVFAIYLELNALLSRDAQVSGPIAVMEARNGG